MSEELSAREREVLALLAQGKTLQGVATALGLSFGTVGTYVARLYRKLGVNNRAQAVSWYCATVYDDVMRTHDMTSGRK